MWARPKFKSVILPICIISWKNDIVNSPEDVPYIYPQCTLTPRAICFHIWLPSTLFCFTTCDSCKKTNIHFHLILLHHKRFKTWHPESDLGRNSVVSTNHSQGTPKELREENKSVAILKEETFTKEVKT